MSDGEREYPVSGGVVSDTVFWWAANWCPPEAAVDPDVYRAMKELYKAGKV